MKQKYVKAVACIRRRPDLSVEEFTRYWLDVHGDLVRSLAEDLGAKRYVQSHLVRDDLSEAFRASRNALEPFDGTAEVWFDRDEFDTEMTPAALEANIALLTDEGNFIDLENSAFFFATEYVMIESEA